MPGESRKQRVLIVDDEDMNRKVLSVMLERREIRADDTAHEDRRQDTERFRLGLVQWPKAQLYPILNGGTEAGIQKG